MDENRHADKANVYDQRLEADDLDVNYDDSGFIVRAAGSMGNGQGNFGREGVMVKFEEWRLAAKMPTRRLVSALNPCPHLESKCDGD